VNGYDLALVLHIAGVVAFFSGAALVLTAMGGARRAKSVEALREWVRMGVVFSRLTPLFGVLLFIPAAYMVSDRWDWKRRWIEVALVTLIVAMGVLDSLVRPRLRRLARAADAVPDGAVPDELRRPAGDPLLWLGGQLFTTLISGVIVLMVFKPDGLGSIAVVLVSALLGFLATAPAAARYRRLSKA
jgi:hypothetical protein